MDLAHREVGLRPKVRVQIAELAVAVRRATRGRRLGRGVSVLEPQLLQRHARAPQLTVHPRQIDRDPARRLVSAGVAEEARFDLSVVQVPHRLPRQPGDGGPAQVLAKRALRHARRRRDLALAQTTLEPKTKNLSNFTHRVTLHRATMPSPVVAPKTPPAARSGCPG